MAEREASLIGAACEGALEGDAVPEEASTSGEQQQRERAVLDKLAALEVQRRAGRDARRQAAEEAANPQENVQAFLQAFNARQRAAQQQLRALAPADSGSAQASAVTSALDALAAEMAAQEARLAEASYYLPSYDLKSCTAQVLELKGELEAARAQLLPKKKFAFNKKVTRVKGADVGGAAQGAADPNTTAAGGSGGGAAADSSGPSAQDTQLVASGHGLANLQGEVVFRTAEQLAGADFVVMDCSGCSIYLLGHMGALRLLRLANCTVIAGPVTGASFMDEISECRLVLASYQIRIHRAVKTDFYLRTRSRPIIEHSSGLRFAPYRPPHADAQALLAAHKLDEDNGMHACVDDFGWIKAAQSPHWSILPEEKREDLQIPVQVARTSHE